MVITVAGGALLTCDRSPSRSPSVRKVAVVISTSSESSVMLCRTVGASSPHWPNKELIFVDLLQVLTLLTMERPISFSAEDIRDEKVSVNTTSRFGFRLTSY